LTACRPRISGTSITEKVDDARQTPDKEQKAAHVDDAIGASFDGHLQIQTIPTGQSWHRPLSLPPSFPCAGSMAIQGQIESLESPGRPPTFRALDFSITAEIDRSVLLKAGHFENSDREFGQSRSLSLQKGQEDEHIMGSESSYNEDFSLKHAHCFSMFYSVIVGLPSILGHSLKPLHPLHNYRNDNFSVNFTEYVTCCALESLPVLQMGTLELSFEKTKEEEVTRGEVRAIS
jgi:hypothetical protein